MKKELDPNTATLRDLLLSSVRTLERYRELKGKSYSVFYLLALKSRSQGLVNSSRRCCCPVGLVAIALLRRALESAEGIFELNKPP